MFSYCSCTYWIFAPFLKLCLISSHQKLLMKILNFCDSCHIGLLVQLHKLLSSSLLLTRGIHVLWHMFLGYWNLILLKRLHFSCHSWFKLCDMMKGYVFLINSLANILSQTLFSFLRPFLDFFSLVVGTWMKLSSHSSC